MRRTGWAMVILSIVAGVYSALEPRISRPQDFVIVHSQVLSQYFYAIDENKVGVIGINPISTNVREAGALYSYLLSENEIDLVEIATPLVGMAYAENPSVRIVGSLISARGDDAVLVVPAGSSVASMEDLAGKTIAVDDDALTPTIMLRELLSINYGIGYAQVEYIEIPFESLLGAIDAGEADAAIVYSISAHLARAQENSYRILSNIFEETKPILGDLPIAAVLATNREAQSGDQKWLERGLALIRKSIQYGMDHRDEVSSALSTRYGLQPEIYALTFSSVLPTQVFLNEDDMQRILGLLDIAYRQGVIDREPDAHIFYNAEP